MAIQEQTFDRWRDLLDAVTAATAAFAARWNSSSAVPFFRGHSSTSYALAPGLFRPQNGSWYSPYDEVNLFYEFRSRAGVLLQADFSSWDILFCMQHYGLPTRLLDWTESFAAALFIDVHFAKHDIRSFHSGLTEDWVHHLAWTTPGSPEVQDDGFGRVLNELVEGSCRNNYPGVWLGVWLLRLRAGRYRHEGNQEQTEDASLHVVLVNVRTG